MTNAAQLTPTEAIALAARAEAIATILHRGQADRNGDDYIEHPRRVAARFDPETDPLAHAAAWLHDTIEDCEVLPEDLRDAKIPHPVIDAVLFLTRRPGLADDDYYRAIRRDPIALRVKLADIDDNTDPVRTAQLDEATRERLARKYAHAREVLLG
ncbi:(p)ppGpp synthase/HD superfamily hydrolase [Leucobacter exalbidus]|uniref:(P)ppGpp synthase/HD superfamily hydrolase n=1 Tax=Leucobacter exalbidus TaxID=662960 RepID=A0A940T3W9_9MICO|nr:phosphohydrolase [Leucobacter exalbidus]MBP1326612.1 (p)ppGpp synthase/HD superfamily hydrolase [Leucobacter exalbidus]